ncbi:MAG: polyprenyl synthetase family protein [Deltaproteobacteria bacterium]|nr:polyprenyl synthetase family protein [Deltaproteobacteria bacterium]
MSLKEYLDKKRRFVDETLDRWLPAAPGDRLKEAMRYSLMAGGKRVRPILAIAACEACGEKMERALPVGCALEMIHTYSLIHDDLPAMDNDDVRRGRPTAHKAFDEATAILAGDSLLTEAFRILSQKGREIGISAAILVDVISDISLASGFEGMAGGQMLDLQFEGKDVGAAELENIHRHKTGKLLQVAVVTGGKVGGGTPEQIEALSRFGQAIGLAFQIADDILDVEGWENKEWKNAGGDAKNKKVTYPSVLGLAASKKKAQELIETAHEALRPFGNEAQALREIASYIIQRRN